MSIKDTLLNGLKITGAAACAGFGWEFGRSLWKFCKWAMIAAVIASPFISCNQALKEQAAKPGIQKQKHINIKPPAKPRPQPYLQPTFPLTN